MPKFIFDFFKSLTVKKAIDFADKSYKIKKARQDKEEAKEREIKMNESKIARQNEREKILALRKELQTKDQRKKEIQVEQLKHIQEIIYDIKKQDIKAQLNRQKLEESNIGDKKGKCLAQRIDKQNSQNQRLKKNSLTLIE